MARREEHPTVNWSAVSREHIHEELEERVPRSLAEAGAKSERLSATVAPDEVADVDTAVRTREWRDRRSGPGR